MRLYTFLYICPCTYQHNVHVHFYTCVCTHVYTHVYTYVYTYVYTHVYTYVSSHVYTHVFTYVYTYAYAHDYTHRPAVARDSREACLYVGAYIRTHVRT